MVEWQERFKADVKVKIKYADIEYKKYMDEGQLIYLQQACEKLFSAVENFLMTKYEKRARNYKELYYLILNNDADSALLAHAKTLHEFFYNGESEILKAEADRMYNSVRDRLKQRLR